MTISLHRAYQNLLDSISAYHVPAGQISRIEVECPFVSPAHWLTQQCDCSRYLWMDRERQYEIAGIGESDVIQPADHQGIGAAIDQIGAKIAGHANQLRYYGGCRFNTHSVSTGRWYGFKAYRFVLPLLELCRNNDRCILACNINANADKAEVLNKLRSVNLDTSPVRRPSPRYLERSNLPGIRVWKDLVNEALAAIAAGEFQKVVLARQSSFRASHTIDPVVLANQLGAVTGQVYLFCFEPIPGRAFIGASPERLYKRNHGRIYSEALAGTRPCGASPETDKLYEDELLHSDKEHREHQIVAEEVCAILRRFCSQVESTAAPKIIKLSGCQHLQTAITGILKKGSNDEMLLQALHPTPAVGGFPKEQAMRWLGQKEPFERGIYAAPVGWIGADESEFCVGIRSGLVIDNTLTLYSGAGIVAGSDPDEEWRELDAKLTSFLKVMREEI